MKTSFLDIMTEKEIEELKRDKRSSFNGIQLFIAVNMVLVSILTYASVTR